MSLQLIAEILRKHHAKREESTSPYSEYTEIVRSRDQVLSKFQPVFADPANITKEAFRGFLEFEQNRHWTGLHRPTKRVCDDMPRLRAALAHLLDESIPIENRIDSLTARGPLSISGLSTGILTPVLLVRYPEQYGVWNGKSEAAMRALKIWPSFDRGTSTGQQYRLLNEVCLKLSKMISLDLWSLDGLWHVVNIVSNQECDAAFKQLEQEERDFYEGREKSQSSYRLERNKQAREACLNQKGFDCAVCDFNFFKRYGELGLRFIHVHHVDDLASIKGERKIDPKTGLVPVCPNCHAMLHKGVSKSRSLDDLRGRLSDAK